MAWKKGQSGKPTGPHVGKESESSFTRALKAAICENKFSILLPDGSTFSKVPREVMADYMAQAMFTGQVRLPTGLEMNLSAKEFMETYWNIITRVDGPPIVSIDQTNHNVLQFDAQNTIFDDSVVETIEESKDDEVE